MIENPLDINIKCGVLLLQRKLPKRNILNKNSCIHEYDELDNLQFQSLAIEVQNILIEKYSIKDERSFNWRVFYSNVFKPDLKRQVDLIECFDPQVLIIVPIYPFFSHQHSGYCAKKAIKLIKKSNIDPKVLLLNGYSNNLYYNLLMQQISKDEQGIKKVNLSSRLYNKDIIFTSQVNMMLKQLEMHNVNCSANSPSRENDLVLSLRKDRKDDVNTFYLRDSVVTAASISNECFNLLI